MNLDVTRTGDQIPELDLTGKTLDERYQVDKTLGRGGMGAVYLARDRRLGREVVVKVPHVAFLAEHGFKERFRLEIESLIRLDHPRVVKVWDAGEVNGIPYAILQYLDGGDLKEMIERRGGKLTPAAVVPWLNDTAQGLDYLHARDLIHRDVKPSNVLFDKQGNAFLGDFGVAKALGERDTGLTQTGATPGSPAYMAPEAVTGGTLNGAYDQYSLATMVYQAVSGRFPHIGNTPIKVLFQKAHEPPMGLEKVAPDVPKEVVRVVMKALSQAPSDRFGSCVEFADAFSRAIPDSTTLPGIDRGSAENLGHTIMDGTGPGGGKKKRSKKPARSPAARPRGKRSPLLLSGGSVLLLVLVLAILRLGGWIGGAADPADEEPTRRPGPPVALSIEADRLEPPPGSTVSSSFNLQGTATAALDSFHVRDKTSGDVFSGTVSGTRFQASIEGLAEGLHRFALTLRDQDQAEFTKDYDVTVDSTAPILQKTDPPEGPVASPFRLTVTANETLGWASINGTTAELSAGGKSAFLAELTVPAEGLDVEVVWRDRNQNQRTLEPLHFTRKADPIVPVPGPDTTTPGNTLAVAEFVDLLPEVGSWVRSPVKISGKTTHPVREVRIDDVVAEFTDPTTFVADVAVAEGDVTLKLRLVMEDGRENEKALSLRSDATAPRVDLALRDGSRVGPQTLVQGTSDEPLASISIDGTTRALEGSKRFSEKVPVRQGTFQLALVFQDLAGNTTKASLTLQGDLAPPQVDLTPPSGGKTRDERVTLEGTLDEDVEYVHIDGADVAVNARRFRHDLTLRPGDNRFRISVADLVGNEWVEMYRIEREESGAADPGVTSTSPGWAEVLQAAPDATIVTDAGVRTAIRNTNLPWRVRERQTGIVMLLVPPGEFTMGAVRKELDEAPAIKITIERAFYLGQYEVSRAEWLKLMTTEPWNQPLSQHRSISDPAFPATYLTWEECSRFLQKAGLRLPTEAEWEYACRAGTTGDHAFSDADLKNAAVFDTNLPLPVGVDGKNPRRPNGWGFHDMHGNVAEFCSDWYNEYQYRFNARAPRSPTGPATEYLGKGKVIRGGSFNESIENTRSARRFRIAVDSGSKVNGLRVARDVD